MKSLLSYQWTTAIIGLIIALVIFFLIRRDVLHVKRSFWWIGIAILIGIMGFFPVVIDKIGILLGVNYPPVLILTIGIGFILVKILSMDLERSQQERILRRLTQKIAILESFLEAAKADEKLDKENHGDKQHVISNRSDS
jgi:hypothetical protein